MKELTLELLTCCWDEEINFQQTEPDRKKNMIQTSALISVGVRCYTAGGDGNLVVPWHTSFVCYLIGRYWWLGISFVMTNKKVLEGTLGLKHFFMVDRDGLLFVTG